MLTYRPIDVSDADLLKRIFDYEEYDIYFAERGNSLSNWAERIRKYYLDTHSYIVSNENHPVGWLMYSLDGTVCDLDIVVLLPEERGNGYGKMIFDELIFRHPQINAFRLDVQQRNKRAVAFYQKYGFTKVAEELQDVGDGKEMYDKMLLKVAR